MFVQNIVRTDKKTPTKTLTDITVRRYRADSN